MIYFRLLLLLIALFLLPTESYASRHSEILSALEKKQWQTAYERAQNGKRDFVHRLATWYYLRNNSQIPDYRIFEAFLKKNSHWPEGARLLKRMEVSFLSGNPSDEVLRNWFSQHPPRSARGQLMQQVANGRIETTLLKTLWPEATLSRNEQSRIIAQFGTQLNAEDHATRVDRLLWDGKTSKAERLIPYVHNDIALLSKARIALHHRRAGVDGLVDKVPSRLKRHPGLIYERMKFRARRKDYAGAAEMLNIAPRTLPYAHLWWNTQKRIIRDAIEDRDYRLAKTLLDKHSQITPLPRVEAEWLRGWLYHAFLNTPGVAHDAFKNIYDTAKYPISRSRGAYWAARAADDMKQPGNARRWYQIAANFPTTFYGQLAHQTLNPNTPLPLPRMVRTSDADVNRFAKTHVLAKYFKELATSNQSGLLMPILLYELKRNNDPSFAANLGALSTKLGAHTTGIKIAQQALNKGIYLPQLFPTVATPNPLAIEPAFALAIARQESRFDREARSSADARGLMQLLPSTARLTAKRHNIPYQLNRLYEPQYNILLGSHYMNGLLNKFDGSKILSIAGYNAGPGRSVQWQRRFGTLGNNASRNIQWMEMIPFTETRNYVQRVLENYHVYHHLLSGGKAALQAREAIMP